MKYLVNYEDINNWNLSEIPEKLKKFDGLKLSECTISKLVFYNGNPIQTGNGVYIFYRINGNKKEYTYVGMCSSHSFVGRIPAHFNIKHSGWFNSYLRNLVNKERRDNEEPKIKVKDFQNPESEDKKEEYNKLLEEQAKISLENHKLILINFKQSNYSKDIIRNLEKLLNKVLIKNDNIIDNKKTVSEYIE